MIDENALIEGVKRLVQMYRELEGERERIYEEMAKLRPLKGCLEYYYVYNKVGQRYWYWRLVYREKGKTIKVHLGKEIPERLLKMQKDRDKLRMYKRRLKEIERELKNLERMIKIVENVCLSIGEV